eukprot:scaffold93854_cov81-Phaeocystis_antarctica.AAC.2
MPSVPGVAEVSSRAEARSSEVDVLDGHVQVAAHAHVLPRNYLPSASATTAVTAGLSAQGGAEAGIPAIGRVHTVGVTLQLGARVGRVHIDQAQPVGRVTTPPEVAARQRQPPRQRAPLLPGHVGLVDEQRRAGRTREARAPPSRGHACVALPRRRAGPAHLPLGRAITVTITITTVTAQQLKQLRLDRGHLAVLELGSKRRGRLQHQHVDLLATCLLGGDEVLQRRAALLALQQASQPGHVPRGRTQRPRRRLRPPSAAARRGIHGDDAPCCAGRGRGGGRWRGGGGGSGGWGCQADGEVSTRRCLTSDAGDEVGLLARHRPAQLSQALLESDDRESRQFLLAAARVQHRWQHEPRAVEGHR